MTGFGECAEVSVERSTSIILPDRIWRHRLDQPALPEKENNKVKKRIETRMSGLWTSYVSSLQTSKNKHQPSPTPSNSHPPSWNPPFLLHSPGTGSFQGTGSSRSAPTVHLPSTLPSSAPSNPQVLVDHRSSGHGTGSNASNPRRCSSMVC